MKQVLIKVDEDFHAALHRYAKADRRTIRQVIMLAVEAYMKQNPRETDE